MDQKISTTDLTKLAMTALGMSMAGNTAKAAGAVEGQFQKLLEQHAKPAQKPVQGQTTEKPETPAEPGKDAIAQEEGVPVQEKDEEDPVEISKRMCVYLAPISQEELAQYPAEWLPQDLEEGESVVCIGVQVNERGQQVPILVGANTAEQMYGRKVIVPEQTLDVSDPEADAMLEATDPTVDHSPAKLLEKVVDEQAGKVMEQAVEEVRPQQEDEDTQVEVLDVQQGTEQVFHEVKAVPIKVGESFETQLAQDVNEQIAAQVIPALEQGQTRVEIQLTPEHLGTVKIEITQSENGSLHVAITAQNSQTRDLLAKNTDSLQNLLAARSQNTVQVEVQRQEESQPKDPYDGHNGQNQQQQQQEQHRSRNSQNSQDFLHQLRLGLVDETWEEE